MQSLQRFLAILSCIFLVATLSAQQRLGPPPPNDTIGGAIDLGLLPAPVPCPTGGDGTWITLQDSTTFATYDNRYFTSAGCFPQAGPDVWYSFQATSNYTRIKLNSLSPSPQFDTCFIKLWYFGSNATSIFQPIPLNCAVTDQGQIDFTFVTPSVNERYYIQVGGHDWYAVGNYSLELSATANCNDCVQQALLELTPPPVFGMYGLGQEVEMCVTLNEWDPYFTSRPHAIIPAFGSDWDLSTFSVVTTPGPDWVWLVNAATSAGTMTGFFYDPDGNSNPSDNTGDPNIGPVMNLTGCWKITSNTFCNNYDLTVYTNIYSDEETGLGGGSTLCDETETLIITTQSQCCKAPSLVIASGTCIQSNGGQVDVTNIMAASSTSALVTLYDNQFINSFGTITITSQAGSVSFPNLISGDYILECIQVDLFGGCTTYVSVHVPAYIEISLTQTGGGCAPNSGTAQVTTNPANGLLYAWYQVPTTILSTTTTVSNLPTGWVICKVTDIANNCVVKDSIFIVEVVPTALSFSYPNSVCSNTGIFQVDQDPNLEKGSYTLLSPIASAAVLVNSANGEVDITNTLLTPPYDIIVSYEATDTATGCLVSAIDTFTVVASPPAPVLLPTDSAAICMGDQVPQFSVQQSALYDVAWLDLSTSTYTFSPIFSPPAVTSLTPGVYNYAVSLATNLVNGCFGPVVFFSVTVVATPLVEVSNDTTICPGDTITALSTSSTANSTFLWQPTPASGNPLLATVLLSPTTTTTYSVTVVDAATGCLVVETLTITTDPAVCEDTGAVLQVYSGLTPNGDGNNDTWIIDGIEGQRNVQVEIYNRWGGLVWQNAQYNNTSNVWQGRDSSGVLVPAGTYFYLIRHNQSLKKGWVEVNH